MRRPNVQFSLRWMLAVIAFMSVLGSHVFTSRKLKTAEDTIRRMASDVGLLVVSGQNRLNVVTVPNFDGMTWRWRMYVPSGASYRLHIASEQIPTSGFAASARRSELGPGEYIVTAALRGDDQGGWTLKIAQRGSMLGLRVSEEHTGWLKKSPVHFSTKQAGSDGTEVAPDGAPFLLLRVNATQGLPGGGSVPNPPGVLTDGIMLWVDEQPITAP
ncbi:MAG TPA: hypothetical protein VND64_35315 [Pirellulales bacterium]|nr:hypothetical protein [Pirellulales bacterium]